MFSIFSALSISILLTATTLAAPQDRTPQINETQKNQQRRIFKGVGSGELTGKEFKRLEKEQRSINREKKAAKADGNVTNRERFEIKKDQAKASRHIFRAKHNRRDR
jgi:hypothetical protein